MYSMEQRQAAIETYIRFDHSSADTIAELGYPSRTMLREWWKEYERTGMVPERKPRTPAFSAGQTHAAVSYYLEHGRSLSRTRRAMGYPKSNATLAKWVDELAPGKRKVSEARISRKPVPIAEKIDAVAELESGSSGAREVAERHGVTRAVPYVWRREILGSMEGGDGADTEGGGVRSGCDSLPDDPEELGKRIEELKLQARKLELEIEVRKGTLELLKKGGGTDPKRLANGEKAALAETLRGRWPLKDILEALGMAKSSYEYASHALERGESAAHAQARASVVASFDGSRGRYGYRRIASETGLGEWTVRKIMKEEGLEAKAAKRRRRYSSYEGEISDAPDNLLRDADGTHHFGADAPNEVWITDVTEFRIPAGKAYLSPIVDCFDGMPISWSISCSPDARMADSSLLGACSQLGEGEHPIVHSDRGCHYRWPGWIGICSEYGLRRSMSRKGCSPDNARAEGLFGRLKVEFFYGRDWTGVTMERFMELLDEYLVWYRDERIKSSLGYRSPMQYRKDLGLAA